MTAWHRGIPGPEPSGAHRRRWVVGLGANVGTREEQARRLGQAVMALVSVLSQDQGELVSASPLIESLPWGRLDQDCFLNGAICLETSAKLQAGDLLAACKSIEVELGRQHRERWGPRELDLDLLLQSPDTTDQPTLRIPHRDLYRRAFALWPSVEIGWGAAGVLLAPALGPTVAEALEALLSHGEPLPTVVFSPMEWLPLPPSRSNLT